MSKSYTFTILLNDLATRSMRQFGDTANSTFNRAMQAQQKWQKSTDNMGTSISRLDGKLRQLLNQRDRATSISSVKALNLEIRKTEREIQKLKNMPPLSFLQRIRQAKSGMAGLLGVASASAVAFAGYNAVKGVLKLGNDARMAKVQFETLTGSAENGLRLYNQINEFANKTPFNNKDLRDNAKLMLNFGIAQQKVLPTLRMLGDVAGGDKQKLSSLSLAYSQVQSAGKLMGQDLLQMINAGFNPLQIISEKTGKSMGQLKDEMSKGAISAADVEQAFRIATSEGGRFHGMMDRMSTEAGGKWSTLVGSFQNQLAIAGEKLLPLASRVIDFLQKGVNFLPVLAGWLGAIPALVDENKVTLIALGVAYAGLRLRAWSYIAIEKAKVIALKASTLWTRLATIQTWSLNAAFAANPVGIVVAGIAGLVAVISLAWKRLGWFRGGVMAAWAGIQGFGMAIKDFVITRLTDFIKGLAGVGNTIWLLFTGRWKKAMEAGREAVSDLVGTDAKRQLVEDAKGVGGDMASAYQKGFNQVGEKTQPGAGVLASPDTGGVDTDLAGGGQIDPSGTENAAAAAANAISGGGSKQTHINVSFGKLIESLNINTTNLKDSADEIERRLAEVLLRTLNSINQMQTA